METDGEKRRLRKLLRRRRRDLTAAQQTAAADAIAMRLRAMPAVRRASRIALYLAVDGEADAGVFLAWALAAGKRCYAPAVVPGKRMLRFVEIAGDTRYAKGAFGIAEPAAGECVDARALDVVLLPLVGFDARGNRLGMGGGFYDATFAFKSRRPNAPPWLIGLAHEVQRVDSLRAMRWDIPLQAVVTPRRVVYCDTNDT